MQEDKYMMNNYDNRNVRREYLNFILKFDKDQLDVITYANTIGLSLDQINIFAHPNFDSFSMREIIACIRDGMSIERLNVVANPEFKNLGKIVQAKIGFDLGLSVEEVSQYAKPEYTVAEMIKMRIDITAAKENK